MQDKANPREQSDDADPAHVTDKQGHVIWTKALEEVRQAESRDIRTRRERIRKRHPAQDASSADQLTSQRDCVLNLPADEKAPLDDLVGVALSGGGIRAAAVSLGVLQSLHETGVIKFVDYLSTVSGGGYAGSAYSAAAQPGGDGDDVFPTPPPNAHATTNVATLAQASNRDAATSPPMNPRASRSPGFPKELRRILYGGEYLFRPWEAANKYLVGLFLNNLLLFSGMFAAATAVAIAWRSLDYQWVRDLLHFVYLDKDTTVAFLPFAFCLLCWLALWIVSYAQRGADAPGKGAQFWLYMMVASLLIGVTMLLANGETTVGSFAGIFGAEGKVSNSGAVNKWLLGIVLAGLTPLLAPGRLLQMGMSPRGLLDRAVFGIVLMAFCVGVPLAVIGIVGRQNISGTRDDPDSNIRLHDIRNWPAFCSLLGKGVELTKAEADKLATLRAKRKQGNLAADDAQWAALARKELSARVRTLEESLVDLYDLGDKLDKEPWYERLPTAAAALLWENDVRAYWKLDRRLNAEKRGILEALNEFVLPSWHLPFAIVKEQPLVLASTPGYLAAVSGLGLSDSKVTPPLPALPPTRALPAPPPAHRTTLAEFEKLATAVSGEEKISDDELRESIADARLSYASVWREKADGKEFNLALLEALHPECFYAPYRIYRFNVTPGDQVFRLWLLLVSALIFLGCQIIDLNSTALHRFYRNRLAYAYLAPFTRGMAHKDSDQKSVSAGDTVEPARPKPPLRKFDLRLDELRNTDFGAPYHILNATVNLRYKTSLAQANDEYLGTDGDQPMEQVFMYSKRFCGCQMTGWRDTADYQQRIDRPVSLANAMALSGAAVSTQMCTSAIQRFLLLALNLNLGQWVPNPKVPGSGALARPWRLFFDWSRRPSRDAQFCFVSDGGFTDNLGVFTLLRRSCRLILAMDAGCDEKHQFEDLGRIVRTARVHLGIHIVVQSADNPQEEVDLDTELVYPNMQGLCKKHFLVAKIKYPSTDVDGNPKVGWLVYMKSSLTGDEGVDILGYRSRVANFPHETTADQFYDSARMETYRQLGMHIGGMTLRELFPLSVRNDTHWNKASLPLAALPSHATLVKEQSPDEKLLRQASKAASALKAMDGKLTAAALATANENWQPALQELLTALSTERAVPVQLRSPPGSPAAAPRPMDTLANSEPGVPSNAVENPTANKDRGAPGAG